VTPTKPPLDATPDGAGVTDEPLAAEFASAKFVPVLKKCAGPVLELLTKQRGRPIPRGDLLKVPFEVGPAKLMPKCLKPSVGGVSV